jgi:hypothetical protein
VLEELVRCKFGAPTQDGFKFSNTKMNTLLIQQTIRSWKYLAQKMRKDKKYKLVIETTKKVELSTKDGRSSTLTRLKLLELRVSIRSSDSTLTDHSTLDLECL